MHMPLRTRDWSGGEVSYCSRFAAWREKALDFVEVAVDENEVGVVAGDELAFVLLGKLGVGRALRVGVERLAAGELVLGEIGLGAGFVHARDGGVESAKRRDGFDGVVGAKGERHACIEKGLPRVGVGGALWVRGGLRPSSCR